MTEPDMPVAVVDTETTGIKPPIIPMEVAILRLAGQPHEADIKERFWSRYNPGRPVELGAISTHHISDEDVKNCPAFSTFAFPKEVKYVVGHNVDYDWEVLGKPDVRRICTLALTRSLLPDLDNHKLGTLVYYIDGPSAKSRLQGAHGALVDAVNCFKVLQWVIVKLGVGTWDQLYAEAEEARIPKRMPFGKHKGQPLEEVPRSYCQWLLGQPDVDPYLRKALEQVI